MINQKSKKILHFTLSFCIFIFAFCILANEVSAGSASLYLSPPSGTYTVGGDFSIRVKVNSGGEEINAAEGTLVFNPDEISAVSISKSDSIFTLWTTEPTFSNSNGTIVFGGGVPAAFSSSAGTIITITFKAKTSASTQVSFSSGSVLAADGKGTNILSNMNGAVYTLKTEAVIPAPEQIVPEHEKEYISPHLPSGAPGAPIISSSTHPKPENWYSNNEPEFSWGLPSDINGVSLLLHKNPDGDPGSLSDGLIESKQFENIEDGIWYFHIKFKNQYGWGAITHRKVLIDTEPPEPFEIEVNNGGDPTNPTPILNFSTSDSLSGVAYYEVKISEKKAIPITAAALAHNPFKIAGEGPGTHTIIVKAVDAADNSIPATIDVEIEPLKKPLITDFPKKLDAGEPLIIKGLSSYSELTLRIFIQGEKETIQADIKTDKEGNWVFIHDKILSEGIYQLWAENIDERGAKSNPTEKISIPVVAPPYLKLGRIAINYLTIIVTFAALILFLVLALFYTRHQINLWHKRVKKETKEVEKNFIKAFRALQEEITEQVATLDRKRGLSKKEKQIKKKLQEALNISEMLVEKEIKDLKKELENKL